MKTIKFLIVAAIMVVSVIVAKSEAIRPVKDGDKVETANPNKVLSNGMIKWYNPARKFGFITPANGGEDLFFQLRDCQKGVVPVEGLRVTYDLVQDSKGKRAIHVQYP
jgi:CspA family cold shock protein